MTIEEWTQDIHCGDAVETLQAMPESSVHCVVTSPPYWQMRDYGMDRQLGLEETPEDYVQNIVEVGEAICRVLRPDGNWWLNLGDTFADSDASDNAAISYRRKSKLLLPDRVAIALMDAGWVVRDDPIWYKTNGMPDPVKDRFREVKEHFFRLAPNPMYWFDLDAVRVPHSEASIRRSGRHDHAERGHPNSEQTLDPDQFVHPNGANPGDVFEGPVAQFPDAHFATFPDWIVEAPVKSSCPPMVCAVCGTPYERRTSETSLEEQELEDIDRRQARTALKRYRQSDLTPEHLDAARAVGFGDGDHGDASQGSLDRVSHQQRALAKKAKKVLEGYFREFVASPERENAGWRQACGCPVVGEYTEPGIVLDPFAGAGTSCLVAKDLGRRFVGIDLNPDYVAMAQSRVGVTVDEPERLLDDESQQTLLAETDGGGD